MSILLICLIEPLFGILWFYESKINPEKKKYINWYLLVVSPLKVQGQLCWGMRRSDGIANYFAVCREVRGTKGNNNS